MKPLVQQLVFCGLCFLTIDIYGQTRADSSAAIAFYFQEARGQLPLYNAVEYRRNSLTIKEGSMYFLSDSFMTGNVFYDDLYIPNARLLYNQFSDELLTSDFTGRTMVRLIQSKVQWFEIAGHHFINVPPEVKGIDSGYHEQIFAGAKMVVLKKQKKKFEERFLPDLIERAVLTDSAYFIKTSNMVYAIKGRKSLLNFFETNKKQVARHLREKELRYRKNKDATIVEACRFYETI